MGFDEIPEDNEYSVACEVCNGGSMTSPKGSQVWTCDSCGHQREQPIDWYFTFGCGQLNAGKYVVFHGTWAEAREMMVKNFGLVWCMQYPSAEAAGVEIWGYERMEVL